MGSAVALGLASLRRRGASSTGLVSALPPFRHLPLVDPGSIVFGGHEVRRDTLLDAVREAHHKAGIFDENLIRQCLPVLRAMQRNVVRGTLLGADGAIVRMADGSGLGDASPAAAVERLSSDIRGFQRKNRLDQVVVIHAASCEPPFAAHASHATWTKLSKAIARRGARVLPPSSLYALAAVEADAAYVNFTPSTGVQVPAILERALSRGLPYMGRDGKTGETLVKSALAPMFAARNLRVLSWVGQNILGNRDGQVLSNPRTKAAKIKSKDKTVASIVGGSPTTRVSIDYVPSLDDWKVAWDFIHFEGFLGTKMSMQFTWSGCDSILAAPLVIDLARFAALERRRGAAGPMKHLAFFFKDPMEVEEHDLASQFFGLISQANRANRSESQRP